MAFSFYVFLFITRQNRAAGKKLKNRALSFNPIRSQNTLFVGLFFSKAISSDFAPVYLIPPYSLGFSSHKHDIIFRYKGYSV